MLLPLGYTFRRQRDPTVSVYCFDSTIDVVGSRMLQIVMTLLSYSLCVQADQIGSGKGKIFKHKQTTGMPDTSIRRGDAALTLSLGTHDPHE